MKKVLVMGGGFAGLSAAVALVRGGAEVILVEQRRMLGGRAYSVEDSTTGDFIDNGQHALLGAFSETRQFLRTLGTEDKVRFQKRFKIVLMEPGGQRLELLAMNLPAPFHLAGGLMRCKGFSGNERLQLFRAGFSIALSRRLPEGMTVGNWMDRLGQSEELRNRFWYPIATAALNEQPKIASADLFLRVLKLAFLGRAVDSPFGIMEVDLSDLYTDQARRIIEKGGGAILLEAPVHQISFSDKGVDYIQLRNGKRLNADYYISALPYGALRKLLPPRFVISGGWFEGLARLSDSPILSIHLWYDRPVMDDDFVGLVGSPIHWVFDKSRQWKKEGTQTWAVACVVSGAHNLIDRTRSELVSLTQNELARYLPGAGTAKLLHSRLIKERQATYSCTPEAEGLRLAQETPISNFFIAGDWTRTDLPATIESAVKSGHRCAELILNATLRKGEPV